MPARRPVAPILERPRLSGWCSAAPGARPKCRGCRVPDCQHECHNKSKETTP